MAISQIWTANGWQSVGSSSATIAYRRPGTVSVSSAGTGLRLPYAITIIGVAVSVDTAPTGADLIVDVNRNGTTIFSDQSQRPKVAAAATFGGETFGMTTKTAAAGDRLTVDVDQVGSTVAGAELTVFIRYTKN